MFFPAWLPFDKLHGLPDDLLRGGALDIDLHRGVALESDQIPLALAICHLARLVTGNRELACLRTGEI